MAKKIKKVKQSKKVKLPPAAEGTDHRAPSFPEYHYATSIEEAIEDRTESMDKLSIDIATLEKRVIHDNISLIYLVTQVQTLIACEIVSIDPYVDDDDLHVKNARAAINHSLSKLERMSRLRTHDLKAIREEINNITTVIEAERERYSNAPTPGAYDDYE
ncbi:hypothetical protein ACC725_25760 [Rhizobium ruizarguesonis]